MKKKASQVEAAFDNVNEVCDQLILYWHQELNSSPGTSSSSIQIVAKLFLHSVHALEIISVIKTSPLVKPRK